MGIYLALYMKFMVFLACGLAGLGFVLKVLMDRVFANHDIAAVWGNFWSGIQAGPALLPAAGRIEAAASAADDGPRNLSTRLMEKRREQLQEIHEVESRLSLPQVPSAATSRHSLYNEDWAS